MAKLIHQSPLGDLEIPTVPDVVPAGVPFDVDDDIAASLLTQGSVFHLASPPKISDLRKAADAAEISYDGLDQNQLVTELALADPSAILPITAAPAPDPDTIPAAADTAAPTEEVQA